MQLACHVGYAWYLYGRQQALPCKTSQNGSMSSAVSMSSNSAIVVPGIDRPVVLRSVRST